MPKFRMKRLYLYEHTRNCLQLFCPLSLYSYLFSKSYRTPANKELWQNE